MHKYYFASCKGIHIQHKWIAIISITSSIWRCEVVRERPIQELSISCWYQSHLCPVIDWTISIGTIYTGTIYIYTKFIDTIYVRTIYICNIYHKSPSNWGTLKFQNRDPTMTDQLSLVCGRYITIIPRTRGGLFMFWIPKGLSIIPLLWLH